MTDIQTDDMIGDEEAKVFLSYSRKDRERAQAIADILRTRHFGVFKDTDDILPTEEWKGRLEQLIEEADTIVFLLSPHSAASEVCAWEVEHATNLNKRIAPIVIDDVDGADIPPLLARLNFIFCTPRDPFENAIDTLCSALSTDIEWIREHTRIAGLAKRWTEAGGPARLLPRGQDIEDVERWRDTRPPETPEITPLQAAYIAEARRAAGRRLRNWMIGGAVTIAVTVALAVFAYFQSVEADRQRVVAEANAVEAATQRDVAEIRRAEAETARNEAEAAREEAVAERNAALLNESRFLAGMSAQMLSEGRAAEALSLAYEALPHQTPAERPLSPEALRALREARLALRQVARLDGQDRIGFALYSPNGKGLATADTAGGIIVRNALTGEEFSRIEGHEGGISDMEFGANNGFLFTGGTDWTPRLWNAATGEKLTDVHGLDNIISAVAVSDDLTRIAAAGYDGTVKIWNLTKGSSVGPVEAVSGVITDLAFSPGSAWLAGVSFEGGVKIWRASDGATITTIGDESDRATAFAFRPGGSEIAIGRENGDIELRRTEDGGLIADRTGQHANAIHRMAYSPDGWTLGAIDIIASYASQIRAQTGDPLIALLGHEERLSDISYSHDSAFVATGSVDGTARVWESETGQVVAVLGGHTEGAYRTRFSPADPRLVTIAGDGTARIWSGAEPLVGAALSTGDWYTVATGFGPDGAPLVVRRDSAARLTPEAAVIDTFQHEMKAQAGAISPDGSLFTAGNEDGEVAVFAFDGGQEVGRTTLGKKILALVFTPDGSQVVIGLKGGRVLVWDFASADPATFFEGEGDVVALAADGARIGALHQGRFTILGPDGAVLSQSAAEAGTSFAGGIAPDLSRYAVFDTAGRVKLRSPDGTLLRVVATPFDSFQLIGFSADGTFLIVGGGAGGTMLFDAVTGTPVARLAGHRDGVTTAAIRDGLLLSGDFGGEVRLRPLFLDPAPLIAQAAEIAGRLTPLSPAARCRFFLDPTEACIGAAE